MIKKLWLLAASVLLLAACGGPADDADPAAPPTADAGTGADGEQADGEQADGEQDAGDDAALAPIDAPDCLPDGTQGFRAGPEGDPALVAVVGEGATGVVLAPQNGGDWCQWAGEVERFVAAGHTVVTFAWSRDMAASMGHAVAALAGEGVTEFAFVGASKGGVASAATADDLGPVAVVALSPPAEFGGMDARATASAYDGPLLVVASASDGGTPAAQSREVARDDATYLEVPGSAHGVRILDGESAEQVREAIDATLAAGFGS